MVCPQVNSQRHVGRILERSYRSKSSFSCSRHSVELIFSSKYTLPAILTAIPVFVSVPFSLTVVTTSKAMHREDARKGGPIFPVPPHDPKAVTIRLARTMYLKIGSEKNYFFPYAEPLGGFGGQRIPGFEPQVELADVVWIPVEGRSKTGSEKQKGQWKQEVTFRSAFTLRCPPSFDTSTMVLRVSRLHRCSRVEVYLCSGCYRGYCTVSRHRQ